MTAKIARFTYKTTPQGKLALRVHYPPGWKATDTWPVIVFFFGGGWNAGSVQQFRDQAAYLAGRGMLAARADYRVRSRHDVTPDACVEDAKSVVRWIRAHAGQLGVDPDRIVASGGSAGGHLAACTATTVGLEGKGEDTTVSSRPNALVLFNPVLQVHGEQRVMASYMAGVAEDVARRISPLHNLRKDTPPAVIFFGTKDWLLDGARRYVARAEELGVRAELILTEGAAHGFFNSRPHKARTLRQADRFLASLGYLSREPTVKLPRGKASGRVASNEPTSGRVPTI